MLKRSGWWGRKKSEETRVKFLFLHRFILYLIMNLSAGEMGRKGAGSREREHNGKIKKRSDKEMRGREGGSRIY